MVNTCSQKTNITDSSSHANLLESLMNMISNIASQGSEGGGGRNKRENNSRQNRYAFAPMMNHYETLILINADKFILETYTV